MSLAERTTSPDSLESTGMVERNTVTEKYPKIEQVAQPGIFFVRRLFTVPFFIVVCPRLFCPRLFQM